MSKGLLFEKASLPDESDLVYREDFSIHRDYSWWLRNTLVDQEALAVDTSGEIRWHSVDNDFRIVPILYIKNLADTDFVVGNRFESQGLQFKILDKATAICLSAIGDAPFQEEKISASFSYDTSSIKLLIDDWFDYFFKNLVVENTSKIPDINELYMIKEVTSSKVYGTDGMPVSTGRYIVTDRLGHVVNSCGHWGFRTEASARNSLRHYTNVAPIPKKHIDAYHKALAIDAEF